MFFYYCIIMITNDEYLYYCCFPRRDCFYLFFPQVYRTRLFTLLLNEIGNLLIFCSTISCTFRQRRTKSSMNDVLSLPFSIGVHRNSFVYLSNRYLLLFYLIPIGGQISTTWRSCHIHSTRCLLDISFGTCSSLFKVSSKSYKGICKWILNAP